MIIKQHTYGLLEEQTVTGINDICHFTRVYSMVSMRVTIKSEKVLLQLVKRTFYCILHIKKTLKIVDQGQKLYRYYFPRAFQVAGCGINREM